MKKYLFILAAAATVLAACTKELKEVSKETVNDEIQPLTYIGAVSDEEIIDKANIDDASAAFTWSTGDQIAVFSGDTYYLSEELASSYNGQASAQFAFADDINAGRSNFAVYPGNLVHNGLSARTTSVNKHTAAELSVTLPRTYELAQVQGNASPAPRIAVNVPGQGLQFKSICAILRLTVKAVSKDCDHITIQFPGKKVNGEFVMSNFEAGASGIVTAAPSKANEEVITISELGLTGFAESLVLNIPVPMGVAGSMEYDEIKVTAWDEDAIEINHIVTPVKFVAGVPTAWAPGRKTAGKLTAYLPAFSVSGSSIEDPDRTLIVFAPGNLEAKLDVVPKVTIKDEARSNSCSKGNFGTASEWRFHAHQYEAIRNYIPEGRTYSLNGLEESQTGDYTDLFCWTGADAGTTLKNMGDAYLWGIFYGAGSGTSGYIGGASGSPTTTLMHDWGELAIKYGEGDDEITYPSNTFRMPTISEWEFVFTNRKLASTPRIKQGVMAMLTNSGSPVAYGMILLPDHYIHPAGLDTLVKVYYQENKSYAGNVTGAICSDNVITLENWQKLEDAGCVFLPTTDMRTFNADPALQTNNAGCGIYWSSTHRSTSMSWALAFCCPEAGRCGAYSGGGTADAPISNVQFQTSRSRYYNQAVRLVRDLK